MTGQTPDPELEAILARRADDLPSHALSPESARTKRAERARDVRDALPVGRTRAIGIPGPDGDLPVRLYEPGTTGPHPVVVFLHGGGWVVGNLDTHDPECRALTTTLDCVVISVGYRLAPDHPFPAALTDTYTALQWAATHAEALNVNRDQVAVAGVSAGGNLAAAAALLARDRGDSDLAYQLLINPVIEPSLEYASFDENQDWGPDRAAMDAYWSHYLERDIDAANPYAAPIHARDLSGVAPATVIASGFDCLRDEAIAYADRLDAAGVETVRREYPAMTHGFMGFVGEPDLTTAWDAYADVEADFAAAVT